MNFFHKLFGIEKYSQQEIDAPKSNLFPTAKDAREAALLNAENIKFKESQEKITNSEKAIKFLIDDIYWGIQNAIREGKLEYKKSWYSELQTDQKEASWTSSGTIQSSMKELFMDRIVESLEKEFMNKGYLVLIVHKPFKQGAHSYDSQPAYLDVKISWEGSKDEQSSCEVSHC